MTPLTPLTPPPILKIIDALDAIEKFADRPAKPPFVKAKFQGLVLICGKCEKRGSGPGKLTAKDARKTVKSALGARKAQWRIVQSSCLGLCPKKAIAIASVATHAPALLAAVRDNADVGIVAARLAGKSVES